MGYKDKNKYQKDLHQQAYDKLTNMQAFGESKKDAIASGTANEKIFSFNTYKTYWKHTKYFISYVKKTYPETKNLKQARQYVTEWLQSRVNQNLSAWTIQTEAKALGKLYGIQQGDKEYFECPKRERKNIKRSRGDAVRDRHFSKTNNDELIKFCQGTGARRQGIANMRGKDLMTRQQINRTIIRYENMAAQRELTPREQGQLNILKDAQIFEKSEYFVYLKEKGGRERIAPIIGPNKDQIVARFRNTIPDDKVWQHVSTNADIHSYRADYANTIYREYARKIEDIPYDSVNNGTGKKYQKDVWHCRKDEKGKKLDKRAMEIASKALGHNRIEVIANNYLRGI